MQTSIKGIIPLLFGSQVFCLTCLLGHTHNYFFNFFVNFLPFLNTHDYHIN